MVSLIQVIFNETNFWNFPPGSVKGTVSLFCLIQKFVFIRKIYLLDLFVLFICFCIARFQNFSHISVSLHFHTWLFFLTLFTFLSAIFVSAIFIQFIYMWLSWFLYIIVSQSFCHCFFLFIIVYYIKVLF